MSVFKECGGVTPRPIGVVGAWSDSGASEELGRGPLACTRGEKAARCVWAPEAQPRAPVHLG